MHDELRAGVDRPRRDQYLLLALIIALMAIAGYFYRRHGERLPGPGMAAPTSSVDHAPEILQIMQTRATS